MKNEKYQTTLSQNHKKEEVTMGIQKTTYHIRNTPGSGNGGGNDGNDKRLVILIDDVFNGLTIENAMLLKVIIENWIKMNGMKVHR